MTSIRGTPALPSHLCFAFHSTSRHREMSVIAAVADRKSLYEVLRVDRKASQREIKTAYRTLAKLYHPDAVARFMDSSSASSTGGAGDEDFIEIHNAYATLSDPEARAVYDSNLNARPGGRRHSEAIQPSRCRRWESEQCW